MKPASDAQTTRKTSLRELHQLTHQKIGFAARKTTLSEREVYLIAKEFFQDLLELNYEFTHDELIEELRRTYLDKESFAKLENFILLLGQLEYSKKQFTQEELKVMLEEMKAIVDQLIHHHHKKATMLEKIIMFVNPNKKKEFDYETTALEELEEKIVKEEEVIDKEIISELQQLIKEATHQTNKTQAKKIFEEIKTAYASLGDAEQRHIYPELIAAAEHIKTLPESLTTEQSKKEPKENNSVKKEKYLDKKIPETIHRLENREEKIAKETKQTIIANEEPSRIIKEEKETKSITTKNKENKQAIATKKTTAKKKQKLDAKQSKDMSIVKQEKKINEEVLRNLQEKENQESKQNNQHLQNQSFNAEETTIKKKNSRWINDHEEILPPTKVESTFAQDAEELFKDMKKQTA